MLTIQESSGKKQDSGSLSSAFLDYFRCPESFATFSPSGKLSEDEGFFRFGQNSICYGRSSSGVRAKHPTDELHDVMADVLTDGSTLKLPFDPSEIVSNLRYERYGSPSGGRDKPISPSSILEAAYYMLRPLLSVAVRKHLQKVR